jgi:putative effector of murein hydrolase LrgA (UPF0299 family)
MSGSRQQVPTLIPSTSVPLNKPSTHLHASSESLSSDAFKISAVSNPVISASLLIASDIFVRRLFHRLAISFPSSLGGCCALFVTMLTLPCGPDLFKTLSPGAALLAKWLPVFFVPSLITLPLAGGIGSATEVRYNKALQYCQQKTKKIFNSKHFDCRLSKSLGW